MHLWPQKVTRLPCRSKWLGKQYILVMPTTNYPVSPALLAALTRADVAVAQAQAAYDATLRTIQAATLDGVQAPEGTQLRFDGSAFVVTTPDVPEKKEDGASTSD